MPEVKGVWVNGQQVASNTRVGGLPGIYQQYAGAAPAGGGGPSAGDFGSMRDFYSGTPGRYNAAQMSPGGGSGFMGANGLPRTFTPGDPNIRPAGSTPPGMVSTGNSIGGFDKNAPLHAAVSNQITQNMSSPGLSKAVVQGTINRGVSSLESGRQANELDLKEQAEAYGGGASGAQMGGLRKLAQDTTNQKAALTTQVTNDAEKDRLDRQEKATATGASLVGGVSDHYGRAPEVPGAAPSYAGGGANTFQVPLGLGGGPPANVGTFNINGNTAPKAPSTAAGMGLGAFGTGMRKMGEAPKGQGLTRLPPKGTAVTGQTM